MTYVVLASAYPEVEVSGLHPGRVTLKTLKKVPTAALFGVEHIKELELGQSSPSRVRTFGACAEKSIGLVALGDYIFC